MTNPSSPLVRLALGPAVAAVDECSPSGSAPTSASARPPEILAAALVALGIWLIASAVPLRRGQEEDEPA